MAFNVLSVRAIILAIVAVLDALEALGPASALVLTYVLGEVVLGEDAFRQLDLLVDEAAEDDHTDVDHVQEEEA